MTLGERIRELPQAKQFTLRDLAAKVGVGFTYISKIENHKLEEGHSPSENLIRRLANELDGDKEELFLLAEKVLEPIRKRVCERPDAFRVLAKMSDGELDSLLNRRSKKSMLEACECLISEARK